MSGGIDAWNGLVSRAEVDQGMYLLEGNESAEEAIALAYGLEAATYRFYRLLAEELAGGDTKQVMEMLARDEIHHKDRLWERYQGVTGDGEARDAFESGVVTRTLEHGKTADQILAEYPDWMHRPRQALEVAMSLEVDSLDLYLRLARHSAEKETADVFYLLANEEKKHLKKVGAVLRRIHDEADSDDRRG